MALQRRKPEAGLVQHSDRGVQYVSRDYNALLQAQGIRISMSRVRKSLRQCPGLIVSMSFHLAIPSASPSGAHRTILRSAGTITTQRTADSVYLCRPRRQPQALSNASNLGTSVQSVRCTTRS